MLVSKIPRVPKHKLALLKARITPLVRMGQTRPSRIWVTKPYREGNLYAIVPQDREGISFLWTPKRGKRARNILEYVRITIYLRPNRYKLLAPTVEEILTQIPQKYAARTIAFEVLPPHSPNIHEYGFFEIEIILYKAK